MWHLEDQSLDRDERARVETLRDYGFLSAYPERAFERVTRLVADIFGVEKAYISLVDEKFQRFQNNPDNVTPREAAICNQVVTTNAAFVVPDARKDPRFANLAGIASEPYCRFYAGVPLRGDNGRVIGALCIMASEPRPMLTDAELNRLHEFAAIVMAEAELSRTARQRDESRAFLERAVDFSNMVMWQLDPQNDRAYLTGAVEEIWGHGAAEAMQTSADVISRIHPEDQEFVRDALKYATEHKTPLQMEFRLINPDRGIRWLAAKSDWDVLDNAFYLIGINVDITDQKNRQEHSNLLMRELHHRMRNLFATVGAIVSLTRQSADSIDDYYERITQRLDALNRAQNVLLSANFMTGSMHALLREVEAGFPRIRWSGPDLMLPENALVSMALLLNELATNAVKHGALMADGGMVEIRWGHENDESGERVFHLRWTESGGGHDVGPPMRTRFGTLLMERSVRNNLGGRIERNWDSGGLICDIYLPARWREA